MTVGKCFDLKYNEEPDSLGSYIISVLIAIIILVPVTIWVYVMIYH